MFYRDCLRRTILIAAGAVGILAFGLPAPGASEPAPPRPNVLLILTDQQRADMLSCAGNRYLRTPAMDGLAAGGVRFERAYCANPVCVPSRFSMMTGVMPSRIGMEHNGHMANPVPPEVLGHALGRVFREAGYETAYGGKVHLPAARQGAQSYGFDYLTRDERDGLADACADFLRRKHDRPFLLVASFINPHDICYMAIDAAARGQGTAPAFPKSTRERECLAEALRLPQGVSRDEFFRRLCPPLPGNFEIPKGEPAAARQSDWRSFRAYVQDHWTADAWRMHRWAYARLTERVDAEIGKVLKTLRETGLDQSTVVVFTSDHGDMDGSHKLEHKSMPYEEATHVPLVVYWKGVTRAGHVDKAHLVSTGLDLIPTLCDFAGIAVPTPLKGRSVKPLAMASAASVEWRGCLVAENERSRVLWTGRTKYAVYDGGEPREMLVDLESDPGEMHNLAVETGSRGALVQHRRLLQAWYRENGETLDARYVVPDEGSETRWILPPARDVRLGAALGEAYRKGVERLAQDPYRSVVYLRADLTFEMNRSFTNYSGDISGRFIEIASLTSPAGTMAPDALGELLKTVADYQKADGHFGREVDWSTPVDGPENSSAARATKTPILWGNGRLLVGLLEAHRAFDRPKLLESAKRLGDFYLATADRLLDPAREAQYRATGTYAEGYVTDYFPAIEGLVRLYQATGEDRYLRHAERMAEFFKRFDKLPIDHSHGNLIAYHGLLLLHETTGKREYLERALERWKQAVEGGYVWPIGGVGEKFHVSCATDEGCSEADWLRLNLDLWRITGETRFLDSAERLLENHYAMNRTANGGYGHHNFVCDAEGPLFMQPKFTEAVWCCTFHGLLGVHVLKSHVAAGSSRGVFINFPIDVSAPVQTRQGVWNVTVRREEDSSGRVSCRVRVDPQKGATGSPPVFLRRPAWADRVQVADADGRAVEAPCEAGYLRLPVRPGAEGQVGVTFSFAPRVENRRLQRLPLDPKAATRLRGVVLCNGPWVLLASAAQPRPVLVMTADKDGRLVLPKAEGGVHRAVTVPGVDATDEQILQASRAGPRIDLAPWEKSRQNAGAAFVFDLIIVPAGFMGLAPP